MKYFFVFLFLLPVVLSHSIQEQGVAGPYTFQLSSIPEQLEPGSSNIIITVLQDNESVPDTDLWLRLSNGNKIYFANTARTDSTGTVTLSYYFNAPGAYDLTVAVGDNKTTMPVHVHGQYILIFGFLTAILIILALLLEKL